MAENKKFNGKNLVNINMNEEVRKTRMGFLVIPVRFMTATIYGMPITSLPQSIKEFLIKKYGDEVFKHIDVALPRTEHPISNTVVPYIPGRAVFTALKEAANLSFKPLQLRDISVLGIYVDNEDMVTVHMYHTTLSPGKESLFVAEVVNAGSTGQLIILGDASYYPDFLRPELIQVGRNRKRGMGLIKLLWPK